MMRTGLPGYASWAPTGAAKKSNHSAALRNRFMAGKPPASCFTVSRSTKETGNDPADRQRAFARGRRRARNAAALGAARRARPEGPQVRLRHRAVRSVHGACERRAGALVLLPRFRGGGETRPDPGRPRAGRQASPGAAGLDRAPGAAVRLLPGRADPDRKSVV